MLIANTLTNKLQTAWTIFNYGYSLLQNHTVFTHFLPASLKARKKAPTASSAQ